MIQNFQLNRFCDSVLSRSVFSLVLFFVSAKPAIEDIPKAIEDSKRRWDGMAGKDIEPYAMNRSNEHALLVRVIRIKDAKRFQFFWKKRENKLCYKYGKTTSKGLLT